MGGNEIVFDWLRGWAQLSMLGYIGLIGLTIYLITITMRLLKNKKQKTFVELERKENLKQIDIAERDSIEWEINKESGLGKF